MKKLKKVKLLVIVFSFFYLFSFSETAFGANFTIDSGCNLILQAHDPDKATIATSTSQNLYYYRTMDQNTLGYVANSYPPLIGNNSFNDLTSFPVDPSGTLGGSYTGTMYLFASDGYYKNWYLRAVFNKTSTGATCNNIEYYDSTNFTDTRIDTVTPYNGETISTSTTNTIGATGYLDNGDINAYTKVKINLQNGILSQCADVICSQPTIERDFEDTLTTEGYFTYSSSTLGLPIGRYYLKTTIEKGSYCFVGYCLLTTNIVSTSTSFLVGTSSLIDKIEQNQRDYLTDLASTSRSSFNDCTVTSFNFFNCFSDLAVLMFVPSPDSMEYLSDTLHDTILTHFPIGYITDFITIISTTTVGTLTPIDAVIPNGVIGSGATITLDLTNSLDSMLNATTGAFTNESASSTETFFEITNYYWKLVLYILAGLYLIRRILGIKVIPHIK